jgi:DNA-binding NtrC family response regulator
MDLLVDSNAEGMLLAEMERRLILSTLDKCSGHRARTAAKLGIGLRTLGLKLKQYREATSTECQEASV